MCTHPCSTPCSNFCVQKPIYDPEKADDRLSLPVPETPWQREALCHLRLADYFAKRLSMTGPSGTEAREGTKAYLKVARFALTKVGALESKLGVHLLVLEARLAESARHLKKEARLNKQALALSRKVYTNTHPWTALALFNRAEDFLEEPKASNADMAIGMLEEVIQIMSNPQSAIGDQFTPDYLASLRKAASDQIANVRAPLF